MPIRLFNPTLSDPHEAQIFEGEYSWTLVISRVKDGQVIENSHHRTEQDLLATLICLMEMHKWTSDILRVNERKSDKAFEDFYDDEVD